MITRASIVVTVLGLVLFEAGTVVDEVHAARHGALRGLAEGAIFAAVVTFLVYGNLVYQAARLGYLTRLRDHRPASKAEVGELYAGPKRPLVALIPSFREEPGVVRQSLLSAALQEYPDKRVVLLIDDPPNPTTEEARRSLAAARGMPAAIEALLAEPARRARASFGDFEAWSGQETGSRWVRQRRLHRERRRLTAQHEDACRWLEQLADAEPVHDHTDALFVEQVLRVAAKSHRHEAHELRRRRRIDEHTLWLGYQRLLARFEVRVSAFERKRYVNLSHEPNKAMNLNSYVHLLGRSWWSIGRPDGEHLVAAGDGQADLVVPDAAYVVTLDADSILVPSYALRLVHVLEQPENERVAVAQTPYSAVPDASHDLERMAGATTDLQYIVHQGFTRHGATFWVGANALIRRAALQELGSADGERGFHITRYIQDRTVIEDTESSVDLIARGWRLLNYPERLSYSATPPDFGSLLIQRRRWANGGLIILPKLLRHLVRRRGGDGGRGEGLMRVHYLTSISGANLGLLALLSYPFATPEAAVWLPMAALPYFFLYARDLHQAGYRYGDVVRVYALNLLLVPVNLAGVAKSVHQGVTGKKIPFSRTPKVEGRTRVGSLYLVAELAMLAYWSMGLAWDLVAGQWAHAVFEAANVGLLAFAISRFIGWRQLLVDLWPERGPRPRPLRQAEDSPPTAGVERIAA